MKNNSLPYKIDNYFSSKNCLAFDNKDIDNKSCENNFSNCAHTLISNFIDMDYQLEAMLLEIDKKQTEMTIALNKITQDYTEIVSQHNRRYSELQLIKNAINERKRRDQEFIDAYHFDGYENIKVNEINELTDDQLKYLLFRKNKKLIKVDARNHLKIKLDATQTEISNDEYPRENTINILKANKLETDFIFPELHIISYPIPTLTNFYDVFLSDVNKDKEPKSCYLPTEERLAAYNCTEITKLTSSSSSKVRVSFEKENIGHVNPTKCKNPLFSSERKTGEFPPQKKEKKNGLHLCSYCHLDYHYLNECPVLANVVCGKCDKRGHTTLYCKSNPRSFKINTW